MQKRFATIPCRCHSSPLFAVQKVHVPLDFFNQKDINISTAEFPPSAKMPAFLLQNLDSNSVC